MAQAKTFLTDERYLEEDVLHSWTVVLPPFVGANRLCKSKDARQYKLCTVKVH